MWYQQHRSPLKKPAPSASAPAAPPTPHLPNPDSYPSKALPPSSPTPSLNILPEPSLIIIPLEPPRSHCSPYLSNIRHPAQKPNMVYTLTVHLHANDQPDSVERIKAKLIEASRVYSKDRETVSWFVMQDVHDPRSFTIVERFETEYSQKYHLENPYWKTFDPYVKPLLDREMDLRRHEELDTSKEVIVPQ
ncbi:hypothetical protein BDP55DRAFT_656010 [Colletotrichum godetiae]|uniref:ABM domain-containing protein n=1 Tax=Colletotrichum godetiae TaxID=1209918 RepID=A0AAJ0AQF5_9PEZI|nr:uncharacterized protein BDP55DRAFT_656010 [Colletotrichum godetiae]KAK1688473.1 hypothetical protein BDP55DRAFT_656010 [Colletotrichum godetiae]